MTERYPQRRNGEWVEMASRTHLIKCCDCGLVHRFDFRVQRAGKRLDLKWRAFRDERKTAAGRREATKRVAAC